MQQSQPPFPTLEHAQKLHQHYHWAGWDQWQPGQPLPDNLPAEDWLILFKIITAPERPRDQLKNQPTSTLTGIERELKSAKQRLWNLRYRLKKQHDPAKQADYQTQIAELSLHVTNVLEPQYKQFKKDALKAYHDHLDSDPHPTTAQHPDEMPFSGDADSLD